MPLIITGYVIKMKNKIITIAGMLVLVILIQLVVATNYFIPTKTAEEWEAFKTNKPDDVEICEPVVEGGFGETWSDWSNCNDGVQHRQKLCNNPYPKCSPKCPGNYDDGTREKQDCGGTGTCTDTCASKWPFSCGLYTIICDKWVTCNAGCETPTPSTDDTLASDDTDDPAPGCVPTCLLPFQVCKGTTNTASDGCGDTCSVDGTKTTGTCATSTCAYESGTNKKSCSPGTYKCTGNSDTSGSCSGKRWCLSSGTWSTACCCISGIPS